MPLSMYQVSVPVFQRMLSNLTLVLDKAMAHMAARKIEPAALLNARLYPDMLSFVRQVQLAADFAKNSTARLAGIDPPKFADTETSFEELKQRIAKTTEFLKSLKPAQIDGTEEKEITFPVAGQPTTFKGQRYLLVSALPNFFFHMTTAYAILRHNGVEIGKRDFIGPY
jgi:uncharacterized protein